MAYPSVLTTFTDPVPTDKLSTTPHSSIETAQNTGLREVQAFIGTESSLVGTLMYDVRGAGSNGGGHVQTANKGGTGQTAYTKGDILVASSSSVLTKLAVGADGTVPTANSGVAAGVSWQGVANATNIQNQAYTYARASVMSASVYGINLSQAVSVLTDGMGFVVKFPTANTTSVLALTVNAQGPSSVTALIKNPDLTNVQVGGITASMIGVVEFDSVSSVFQLVAPSTNTGLQFISNIDGNNSSAIGVPATANMAIVDLTILTTGQPTVEGEVTVFRNGGRTAGTLTMPVNNGQSGATATWSNSSIVIAKVGNTTSATATAYLFK